MSRRDWKARLAEILKGCSERGWCSEPRSPDAGEPLLPEQVKRAEPLIEALDAAGFWFCLYPTPGGGLFLEHFDQEKRTDRAWLPHIEIDFSKNDAVEYLSCEMATHRDITFTTYLGDPNAVPILTALLLNDRAKNEAAEAKR